MTGRKLPGKSALSPARDAPRRILVIDDEPGIRGLAARILGAAGCTVVAAATGREGLEIGVRGPWDLVLLDLCLPDLGGEEILPRLRRARPWQPVLVWSATADRQAPARCRALGASGYLPKPFTRAELLRSIAASCPAPG
jgi:CheY-like chemotaxis protein